MIILGIDPGTATTGYGVIKKLKNDFEVLAYGIISTPKGLPAESRLLEQYNDIVTLLKQFKPEVCGIEKLFYTTNQKTVMAVSQARGMILLALAQHGIPIVELTPLQVKNYLTGYGKSDKKSMQKMIKQSLHLTSIPKPDDAADALAIAYCTSLLSTKLYI